MGFPAPAFNLSRSLPIPPLLPLLTLIPDPEHIAAPEAGRMLSHQIFALDDAFIPQDTIHMGILDLFNERESAALRFWRSSCPLCQ